MAGTVNTAEGGTSGTAATVANTGGGSGTAFNLVSTGIAFLSSTHIDGVMTYQVSPSSGSINVMRRTGLSTKLLSIAGSTYMTLSPTSDTGVVWIGVGSTRVASIHIQGTGRFRVSDASGTTGKFTASAAMPINTAVRWELAIEVGTTTTNGRIQFKSFLGSSTTPVDTYDSGYTVNLGTANLTQIDFGKWSAGTYATAYEIDSLRYDDTQAVLLGPFGVPSNFTDNAALSSSNTLTAVATGSASASATLSSSNSLTATAVASSSRGKIVVIGDSLTNQSGGGQAALTAKLVARGWLSSEVYFYAVDGKHYATADTNGKTTVQNVADFLTAIGGQPALWLIALGTNDRTDTYANNVTKINAIITAIGGGLIRWVNTTYSTGPDADITRGNLAISDRMVANAPDAMLDWNAFVHNGRDETGFWQPDTIHMYAPGYDLRNTFVADGAAAAVSTYAAAVALSSTNTLSASATPAVSGVVVLASASSLTAAAVPAVAAGPVLASSSSLTAIAVPKLSAAPTLASANVLSAVAVMPGSAAVVLSSVNSLTGFGKPALSQGVVLASSTILSASSGQGAVGTAALSSVTTLTVSSAPQFAAAPLLGSVNMLAVSAAVGFVWAVLLISTASLNVGTVVPPVRDITVTIGSPWTYPLRVGRPAGSTFRVRAPWR